MGTSHGSYPRDAMVRVHFANTESGRVVYVLLRHRTLSVLGSSVLVAVLAGTILGVASLMHRRGIETIRSPVGCVVKQH